MRTFSVHASLFKTNKTGPLFKVLTVLFILIQIPMAKAEGAAFDYVTLAEINTQAQNTWNHLVQSKGRAGAEQSLRQNPSSEVQALGQQLQQFLQTSQVHFESLKAMGQAGQVESMIGAKMHPFLRHLLINSVMLDIQRVVKLTKPGLFSRANHRARVAKVYLYAFPNKGLFLEGAFYTVTKEEMEGLDLQSLMMLARTSALAALLLQISETKDCSQLVDVSWALQVRRQVLATSVGFSAVTLLVKADDLGMNEFVECFKEDLTKKLQDTNGAGVEILTEKQLIHMAAQLLGQDF